MRASIVVGLSRVSICYIRSSEHPEGTLSWTHPGNRSPYCAKFFLCFTFICCVSIYPSVKIYFLSFWGMVMYDNKFKTKKNKILNQG